MKIKQLIDLLSKYNPELDVMSLGSDSSGYSHNYGAPNCFQEYGEKFIMSHFEDSLDANEHKTDILDGNWDDSLGKGGIGIGKDMDLNDQ